MKKKLIGILFLSLTAIGATSTIDSIINGPGDWKENISNWNTVILGHVLIGDDIRSDVLNAKFSAVKLKVDKVNCENEDGKLFEYNSLDLVWECATDQSYLPLYEYETEVSSTFVAMSNASTDNQLIGNPEWDGSKCIIPSCHLGVSYDAEVVWAANQGSLSNSGCSIVSNSFVTEFGDKSGGTCSSVPAILISSVYEGSGLDKIIELYIGQDIPDLSIYELHVVVNGGTSSSNIALNGSAFANTFFYVYNENTDGSTFDPTEKNAIVADVTFNGNDSLSLQLVSDDSKVDYYGIDNDVDVTGSSDYTCSWCFKNKWVSRANGTGPDSIFESNNWTINSDLGSYSLGTYQP